jgi:N-ethylmaleimide reductase
VERIRAGLPLAEADPDTYYTGGDDGYLTYPAFVHPRPTALASA